MYDYTGDLEGEVWKFISNTDRRYKVSSCGRILSMWRVKYKGISRKPLILEPTCDSQGYQRITVQVVANGESIAKEFFVHRLVAREFLPNPDNKATVNHIDGDKSNNCVANLEWATQSENNKHAYLTGLNSNHLEYNTQKKEVACLETGETWPSLAQASYAAGFRSPSGLQYYVVNRRPYRGLNYYYSEKGK